MRARIVHARSLGFADYIEISDDDAPAAGSSGKKKAKPVTPRKTEPGVYTDSEGEAPLRKKVRLADAEEQARFFSESDDELAPIKPRPGKEIKAVASSSKSTCGSPTPSTSRTRLRTVGLHKKPSKLPFVRRF